MFSDLLPDEYLFKDTYPMTKAKRGLCLIIDNEKFEHEVLPFREGSQIDANNLDILFTELGFHVTIRRNLVYNVSICLVSDFFLFGV